MVFVLVEVSIVIPCLDTPRELVRDIKRQTFRSHEIVLSKGRMPIAAAWNRGIERARGKRIILIESDVRIYEKDWLARMVKLIDKHKVVRADSVIVRPYLFSLVNVGMNADIAKKNLVAEDVPGAEDTEWYDRMKSRGHVIRMVRNPVVWHFKYFQTKSMLKRAFYSGITYSKIALQYRNPEMSAKRILLGRGADITFTLATILGNIYGFIRYFYKVFDRK